jgi:hypothetical protein
LVAWSCLVGAADAAQTVKLSVGLQPERLGAGTTIEFGFRVDVRGSQTPSPLSAVDLFYPANIGLVTSGLGLSSCAPATLELSGPEGCPVDALMGRGSAVVEIPLGRHTIIETGEITTWMGPLQNGRLSLLFFAEGRSPVFAQLIFPGLVLDASAPFGGRLATQIPEIPSFPEAPDAAIVQMHATIGPKDIVYFQRVGHRRVGYQPNGIVLPKRCPRGGFAFAATFAFLDGSKAHAHATVPCPARRHSHH